MHINPVDTKNVHANSVQKTSFRACSLISDKARKLLVSKNVNLPKFEHFMDLRLEGHKPIEDSVLVELADIDNAEFMFIVKDKFLKFKYDTSLTEQCNAKMAVNAYYKEIEPLL